MSLRHLGAFLVFAALLVPAVAPAQGFHAATSKDGVDVWAVGDSGRVWRSLNGGSTFASQQLGYRSLRGIAHRGFNVLVVGDSGYVLRSTDNGGSFVPQSLGSTTSVRAVASPSANRAFVAGDGGMIQRSDDGGTVWAPQTSGTGVTLYALAFTDDNNGWAAGAGGTLLRTTNGGGTWTPVALGTTNDLFAVAQRGSDVWVGGANSAMQHSTNSGSSFAPYNLRTENLPDVRAIALPAANEIWVGGGGGFVRRSIDNGLNWTWPVHELYGQVSALAFAGGNGWAVSNRLRTVTRWTGGTTMALPTGSTLTRTWAKIATASGLSTVRGKTIAANPKFKDILYAFMGDSVYRSPDGGDTWRPMRSIGAGGRLNAMSISPKDTMQWVIAHTSSGGSREIWRSIDAGATWSSRLTHAFGEYGIPLERNPDKPDTLFFGGDSDTMFRSVDAGLTWNRYGNTLFRSPCDIIVTPDADNYVLVGDGITGSGIGDLFQSGDGGATYTLRQSVTGSEIPGMSLGRLRNNVAYATTWSTTGVRYSSDNGKAWPLVTDLNRTGQNVSSSWGTDVAGDDPNVVLVGQYSGGNAYLSWDGGTTFTPSAVAGSNYSFLARDRSTLLALQSGGIYKLRFNYAYTPSSGAQTLAVVAPNGGEVWNEATVHNILWSGANVAMARIEWRANSGDSWHLVADVDGYAGSYAWTIPSVPTTTTAEVRVRDAWDSNPVDVSNATFTIQQTALAAWKAPLATLDMQTVDVTIGEYGTFTVQDTGLAALVVSNVTSDNPLFVPVRTSFTIGVGQADTLGVFYSPVASGPDSALLTVTANDPGSPHTLRVRAVAGAFLAAGDGLPAAFLLAPTAPNPFSANGRTLVRFDVPRRSHVKLEVFDVQGHRVSTLADGEMEAGRYAIPFGSGAMGDSGGRMRSGVFFLRMTAPGFKASRRMLVIE